MLREIVRKEWLELVRDGRVRLLVVCVGALAAVALATAAAESFRTQADRVAAEDATWQQFLSQGAKNAHSAAHYGTYAFRPASPVAFVDAGVTSQIGSTVWAEPHRPLRAAFPPVHEQTPFQRLTQFDAGAVLRTLIPLLVFVLTFAAIAGEREAHTLRAALGTGVHPVSLALGKGLAVTGLLGVTLLPAFLLAGIGIAWASQFDGIGFGWASRVAGLALTHGLTLLVFLLIGLAASAWLPTARAALLVLLGFWIAGEFVLPRMAADVAGRWYPVPAAVNYFEAITRAGREGARGLPGEAENLATLTAQWTKEYGVTAPRELPFNYLARAFIAHEDHLMTHADAEQASLRATYDAQDRLGRWLMVLAPSAATRVASAAFAGTDRAHHEHWTDAVEHWRRRFVRQTYDAIVPIPGEDWEQIRVGPEYFRTLERFRYRAPDARFAWGLAGSGLMALSGWVAAACAVFWLGVRRLERSTL